MPKRNTAHKTVARNSLFREIQLEIRNYILEHNLQPGDMLPPAAEIAAQMGVSSATLREAFRALEALGVLTTKHGVGTFIRAYDLSPILENLSFSLLFASDSLYKLVQIREAMEVGLIAEVVGKISAEQVEELDNILVQMSEADPLENDMEIVFHTALYSCLDNDLIPQFLDIFWVVHRDLVSRSMIFPTAGELRWEAHVPIVKALKEGDAAAAVEAMHIHFDGIKSQLENAYRHRITAIT